MSKQDAPGQHVRRLGHTAYQAAVRLAVVAGVFCLIVVAVLVGNALRAQSLNIYDQTKPLDREERDLLEYASRLADQQARYLDPAQTGRRLTAEEQEFLRRAQELARARRLAMLKMTLQMDEADEAVLEEVRAYDAELRARYQTSLRLTETGRWLLMVGGAAFLVSLLTIGAYRAVQMPPTERPPGSEVQQQTARFARWSVAGAAVAVISVAFLAGLFRPPTGLYAALGPDDQPPEIAEEPTPQPPVGDPAENWPGFRGPSGLGVAYWTDMPRSWDGESGENIRWKTAIPLPGNNSPVVWEDRVFLSGATETEREIYCFDADTGELLWRRRVENVPRSPTELPEIMDMTGYAAPTMATDGARAYAIFANGDLAAVDFEGNVVWQRNLGLPDNRYGHASSLITHGQKLIVQYDQGNVPEDGLARIIAFDGATGDIVWEQTDRPVRDSWSSPSIIEVDETPQLITTAAPWVIAYDPASGAELWRANCLRNVDAAPSPTYIGGLLFVCNEGMPLIGIRPTGTGDVTESHVVWEAGEHMPDTASPIGTDGMVFTVSGVWLNCYGIEEEDMLWEHGFDQLFYASPIRVGDHIYVIDSRGTARIFRPSKEGYQETASPELGEGVSASPAFVRGRIYVRGEKHLYCIEKPTE